MKTLNTLINEQNISENTQTEQPINESVALIAGLFGALAMGIGALFKSAKKAWEKADEPSKEDKAKAKDNEKNMDDSTKAAYDNAMDELDESGDKKTDEDKEKEKELEDAEEKGGEEELEHLKSEAERLIDNLNKDSIKYPDYCIEVYRRLHKIGEENDDKEALELAKKLKKKTSKYFGDEDVNEAENNIKIKRVQRCYLSQIAINASVAYSQDKKILGPLKDLLANSAGEAKKKLNKEKSKKSKAAGSDLGLETMVDYVIKVALGLSSESLENELFLKLIDDINFVSAVEVLISATMIINANPESKERLETYQKLFNTLGLQIQLNGK